MMFDSAVFTRNNMERSLKIFKNFLKFLIELNILSRIHYDKVVAQFSSFLGSESKMCHSKFIEFDQNNERMDHFYKEV